VAQSVSEGYEQISLVPRKASEYQVRALRAGSWIDLELLESAEFNRVLVDRLRSMAGLGNPQIAPQEGRFRYRVGDREVLISVVARRTGTGQEQFELRFAAA